jgi:hypothetical protein
MANEPSDGGRVLGRDVERDCLHQHQTGLSGMEVSEDLSADIDREADQANRREVSPDAVSGMEQNVDLHGHGLPFRSSVLGQLSKKLPRGHLNPAEPGKGGRKRFDWPPTKDSPPPRW